MITLKNKLYLPACFIAACLLFVSCQKDIDYISIDNQGPDLITKVSSSVSGFVIDENNAAVLGADVFAGGVHTTTDKYGFFEIKNIMVVKNAAVVTVTKPNYFKGIKTYIGENNKAAFFRIKLIPKTNAGSINASSGGNVSLSNGMTVALPANAVVTASSNVAYTGSINVAVHWIDPTSADLNQTMPGDLRGIAADGGLKLLTTYGMAAVELTGSGGELLQIASGKKATLTMTIPASIMGTAPSSIPLWSFDEGLGLWKQEGQATKTGNTYVGEVSHFSFWNCDVPNTYVHFDCTLKDPAGNPIPFAIVRISMVSNPNSAAYGYTDATGYVGGAVPDNTQLLLEIYSSYGCGVVYSQNFTTTSTSISLGTITVNAPYVSATVSGTVTDCSNNPVTNGRVILYENGWYSIYPLSNTGTFSFLRLLCNGNTNVDIIGEDMVTSQQSASLPFTIVPGANSLPPIQACGTTTQEFINYSIDGGTTTTHLAMPGDSIYHYGNGSTSLSSVQGYTPGGSNSNVYFTFENTSIAVGSIQNLNSFYSGQMLGQGTTAGTVHITEYGSVGQFIAGTISGTVVTTNIPPTTYNIVCSFRVRRSF